MLKGKLSIALCASVLAWGLVPNWGKLEQNNGVFAQDAPPTTEFTLPETVPDGTTVKVETTDSMQPIAEAVQGGFTQRYEGSNATITVEEADTALQDLADGNIDIAAVGRPLTQAEKDEGLVPVPVSRHKIAMIVGVNNPFAGSLTIEEFAKIFRGEITNWSEVGGTDGTIRLIDRPEGSDTRQAFPTYPVFQEAPFETGATAEQVAEDDTDLVVEQLGTDGISYAVYDQVKDNPNVKIVQMHDTLPDNPDYPFSQPLYFVYKGPEASPQVQAFLGYATAPETEEIIEQARVSRYVTAAPIVESTPEATPEETPVASPEATPEATPEETPVAVTPVEEERGGGFPWWLLLIPLLGLLAFFLLRNGEETPTEEPAVAPPPPPPPPAPIAPSRLILTPRNCRDAYAYWEVPEERKAELRRQGGENLTLRLYDVTDIDIDRQDPHHTEQFNCSENDPDLHVPIERDGRDYIAELGYITNTGNWLSIARSLPVRVPNCPPEDVLPDTEIAAVAPSAVPVPPVVPAPSVVEDIPPSRIIITPRSCREAYVYWETPDIRKAQLKEQGGENMLLRIYDVTDIDIDQQSPHSTKEYYFDDTTTDYHVPIERDGRDYIAELGYLTDDNRFLSLARSLPVRVPDCPPEDVLPNTENASVAPLVSPVVSTPSVVEDIPPSRIIITPRSCREAYVYWETPDIRKAQLKEQGGENMLLRIYDVTDIDIDQQAPHSTKEYYFDDTTTDYHVPIERDDRDYMAELGYLTDDNRFLSLARSLHVRVPACSPEVSDQELDDAAMMSLFEDDELFPATANPIENVPNYINLVPRSPDEAYVSWRVSEADKANLRQQGGETLILRLYDLTDLNDDGKPDTMWDHECSETDQDRIIPLYQGDRNYMAELGYRTAQGRWLPLIQSDAVYIPPKVTENQ